MSSLSGIPSIPFARSFSVLVLTIFLVSSPGFSAEHQETITREFEATSGMVVDLENLAGRVTLRGGSGKVLVEGTIHAEASNDNSARALASKLTLDISEQGNRLVVRALYPVGEHKTYSYPGSSSSSSSPWGGSSSTRYQGQKVKVTSKSNTGVTLYADFVIQLPAGVGAKVRNVVGDINAADVEGSLWADTGSGKIRATGGRGSIEADTGSGDVEIRDHQGAIDADTGSGDVSLSAVLGSVTVDTGSGDVTIEDTEGNRIDADTGSGSISLRGVTGEIRADTGSGRVEGHDLRATGDLRVDTGSGGISLDGDFSSIESMEIDAGSGRVSIEATGLPGIDLDISTGSGGIDVDLPNLQILEKESGTLRARTGNGGVRVSIDTGSGGVSIR